MSDLDLLRQYSQNGSEEAFATLVTRHLNLVYATALRQVRSPQLAEEVAQSVFLSLARNSKAMKPDTVLAAWLYRVTRHAAIDLMRGESRRQAREQTAFELANMKSDSTEWAQVEPLLDEALETLDETDRSAILLRYFENKSLREVGETLGTSEDAAQKRVSRAVEQLRGCFSGRGIAVSATVLIGGLCAQATQVAPVGLSAAITTAAAFVAPTLTATSTATAAKAIAMTTLQKTLIAATLVAAVGTGIYEARQAANMRIQVQALQQAQGSAPEQIEQLTRERDDATRQLASLREEIEGSNRNNMELLKLRGEVGTLRSALAEASRQKAGNQTSSAAPHRGNEIPIQILPGASTTDLNPVTRVDARFEISQLRDVGNDSIETAAQTALWSVFNRDEQGFDRIRYRDPEAPQLTAKELQEKLEGLARRFAGAADVTIAFWSKEGDNRRLVHFLAPCPDNNQSTSIVEEGSLVFQRVGTGWNLDQFVVQSRVISKPAK